MAAPTFVNEYEPTSNWGSTADGATRTTGSFNVTAGDTLVLFMFAALSDKSAAAAGPSATGGSITWTSQENVGTSGNFCRGQCWTGAVGATATGITVSLVNDGGSGTRFWGFTLQHWRGSGGIGAAESSTAAGTAPSRAITTTGANSAIAYGSADWSAVDGGSRTWRTINSITPTSGNSKERVYFRDSSQYTVYSAYWDDAGATGSKTTGLSAPSGQDATMIAIEILAGSSGYTIAADGSTYSLTGAAATTKLARKVAANGGTYSLTGAAATLKVGFKVAANGGTYSLTGAAATTRATRLVAANGGTYTLTGSAASLLKGAKVAADGGTYSLSGAAASLLLGRKVAANSSSYALTGADATLTHATAGAYTIVANGGTYSLSGADASLLHASKVVASGGTYALTGAAATLRRNLPLAANGGTYALSGASASLLVARKVAASGGTYTLSGSDATLVKAAVGYTLTAGASSYEITGQAPVLTHVRIAGASFSWGPDDDEKPVSQTALKRKVQKAVKEAVFEDGILTIEGVLDAVMPALPASTVSKTRTQEIIRNVARAMLPIARKMIEDDEDESDLELLLLVA